MRRVICRIGMLLVLVFGAVAGTTVAPPAHAADLGDVVFLDTNDAQSVGYLAYCDRFWPSVNTFETTFENGYSTAKWWFRLSKDEADALDCMRRLFKVRFVELDFRLFGFDVPGNWEGYNVLSTNIPGAVHDVAFEDNSSNVTPGITGVSIEGLKKDTWYYAKLGWNAPLIPGDSPRVSFQWVPSHWADLLNPHEAPCWAAYVLSGFDPAWCIFGTTRAYVSQGYNGASIPFSGMQRLVFPQNTTILPPSSEPGVIPPSPASISRQLFLRGDSKLFAKDTLSNGGWTEESASGSISKIAVGGATQVVLNACNAVFARTTLGIDGWTQETPCGGAQQIAVSSTGLQVLLDANFAVWAKYGIGDGGWIRETDDYSATKIAVGGNTQMLIDPDGAVHAKTWLGYGGWVKEHTPQNPADKATAIAADNTGMQAFIRGDAAVFAKRGVGEGGWQQQAGPGNADAIAAGSGVLMFLRGDGAVFAKTNIAIDGGWLPQADPHTVTAIAMGNSGRMMIRSDKNAVFAKDNLVNGDWHIQVGDGNAAAIAVG